MANTPNTAPTATAAAPLAMSDAFSTISAFASSISSCRSNVIRSETSVTADAMFSGCPFSAGKASEDQGEHETSRKRSINGDLRAVAGGGAGGVA